MILCTFFLYAFQVVETVDLTQGFVVVSLYETGCDILENKFVTVPVTYFEIDLETCQPWIYYPPPPITENTLRGIIKTIEVQAVRPTHWIKYKCANISHAGQYIFPRIFFID